MNEIAELKLRAGELVDRMQAIQAKADADKRDVTEEEKTEIQNCLEEFDRSQEEIGRREGIAARAERASAGIGRKTEPSAPAAVVDTPRNAAEDQPRPVASPRVRGSDGLQNTRLVGTEERGRWGFSHPGEFYSAVIMATVRGQMDQRLVRNAATTFGVESIGEDGGFAVPPDWRASIVSLIEGEESLAGRCDQQPTTSNQITIPVDEIAPWHAAGVRASWLDEAQAKPQTKPNIQPLTVRANKLAVFVYLTDELLEDSAAMGSYVQRKAPLAIQWKLNDAIINGGGAGQPLGILNSACLVSTPKDSGQAAATLTPGNVTKMYSRMMSAWRSNAVWLYNQDIEPQLLNLNTIVKNVAGSENVGGGYPLYMPPGGLSASPYGTLLGRPMVATEACQTLGTKGDIIFANLQMYMLLVKSGGIRSDVSIHVEFERDITAFRFVMRVGGQPWLSAPVARANGTNTFSPFVTRDFL